MITKVNSRGFVSLTLLVAFAGFLAISTGMTRFHGNADVLFAQAVKAVETTSKDCEAAKRLAASGVFSGTQTAEGKVGLKDACIAAVFDSSKVSTNENNSRINPKNFTCVGKITTVSIDPKGLITENWNASSNVPSGTCSARKCSEGICGKAVMLPGVHENFSQGTFSGVSEMPVSQNTSQVTGTNIQSTNQNVALSSDPAVSNKIDDTFSQVERVNTSLSSEKSNPSLDLEVALYSRADEMNAMSEYERSDTPAEIKESPAYQSLLRISSGEASSLSPEEMSKIRSESGFPLQPESETVIPQPVSTFGEFSPDQKDDSWYGGFRRSENIEDERPRVFGSVELAATLAEGKAAVRETVEFVGEKISSTWNTVSSYFGRPSDDMYDSASGEYNVPTSLENPLEVPYGDAVSGGDSSDDLNSTLLFPEKFEQLKQAELPSGVLFDWGYSDNVFANTLQRQSDAVAFDPTLTERQQVDMTNIFPDVTVDPASESELNMPGTTLPSPSTNSGGIFDWGRNTLTYLKGFF